MPGWVIAIIKLAIQFGGPLALSALKKWLETKYPDIAQIIEELIGGIKNPDVPNKVARANAKECFGVACQTGLTK